VAEDILRDMPGFEGYLGHELIRDLDDLGHLVVVSRWTTRQRADDSLVEYAGHPNARRAEHLVPSRAGASLAKPSHARRDALAVLVPSQPPPAAAQRTRGR